MHGLEKLFFCLFNGWLFGLYFCFCLMGTKCSNGLGCMDYIYLCHLFVLAATNIRGSHPMIKITLSDATFINIIMNHYVVLGKKK